MFIFKCPHCKKKTISYKMKSNSIEKKYSICENCGNKSQIKRKYLYAFIVALAIVSSIGGGEIEHNTLEFYGFYILMMLLAMLIYVFILPLSKT